MFMVLENTLDQISTPKNEVGELPEVAQKFEEIYSKELIIDEDRHHEGHGTHYSRYRALRDTLRSENLNQGRMKNDDIRTLSTYLVNDPIHSEHFREWIRVRTADWERKTISTNAQFLYAVGRKEFLRKDGKK